MGLHLSGSTPDLGTKQDVAALPQDIADELDNGLAPSHRVLDAGYAHNDVAGNLVIGTARVPALSPVYMTQAAYDASAPHDPFVAYIIVTS